MKNFYTGGFTNVKMGKHKQEKKACGIVGFMMLPNHFFH